MLRGNSDAGKSWKQAWRRIEAVLIRGECESVHTSELFLGRKCTRNGTGINPRPDLSCPPQLERRHHFGFRLFTIIVASASNLPRSFSSSKCSQAQGSSPWALELLTFRGSKKATLGHQLLDVVRLARDEPREVLDA